MGNAKYRYNTRTLSYERVESGLKQRLLRLVFPLTTAAVAAALVVFFVYPFVPSPREQNLQRENAQLKLQFELLDKKMDHMQSVLANLEHRDNDIYRVIFEAEPIPENIRRMGVGGVNRYEKLEGYDNSKLLETAHRRLDSLARQLVIQSVSFDSIFKLAKKKEDMLASIPAIQPVSNKDLSRMASGYGMRIHPVYKTERMHAGMDFSAEKGTEIYATGNGTVVEVKRGSGFGKHVVIEHGYGYKTVYAHMSDYNVRKGQKVKRGEVIGYIGSTGISTAPHLHYEVHKNGRPVNPANYYFNDLSPEQYEEMLRISSQVNQSFD